MAHRILVVDDEASIRALLREELEERGYRVYEATDGQNAIGLLNQKLPHFAVVDFLLPKKNGFAVAEAIRRHPQLADIAIVIMSGVFKNPKTAVEAREKYQVVDFLSKPLDVPRLLATVDRLLAGMDDGPDINDDPPPPEASPPAPRGRPEPAIPPAAQVLVGAADADEDFASEDVSINLTVDVDVDAPPPRGLDYTSGAARGAAVLPARGPRPGSKIRNPFGDAASEEAAPEAPVEGDTTYEARPFPSLPAEGHLNAFPLPLVLSTVRFDQKTGMLDLTDEGVHRRIYVTEGEPTFMQSNAEGENVGALLLRRGRITRPDFDRSLQYMRERGRTLQQALLELRLVSESDLATAYTLLAGELLPQTIGMADGRFLWRETDAFLGRVPEGRFDTISAIFTGIVRYAHPPQMMRFFQGREALPLVPTREFEPLLPQFRRAFGDREVSSSVDGRRTVRDVLDDFPGDTGQIVPQLFALVTSGMAVLVEAPPPAPGSGPGPNGAGRKGALLVPRAGGSAASAWSGLELDTEDATGDPFAGQSAPILRQHARIMGQTFFEVLGVEPDAPFEALKAAYFDLIDRWSPAAFPEVGPGPDLDRLHEIRARLEEAYRTVSDRGRRLEYLEYLDRRRRGLTTDPERLAQSERWARQAKAMIQRSDWSGAHRALSAAVEIDPAPEYYAKLGWVLFNLAPNDGRTVSLAVKFLKQALSEQSDLSVALQYLGNVAHLRGQASEARKWWTRCLKSDPRNVDAQRGLEMLSTGRFPSPLGAASRTQSGGSR